MRRALRLIVAGALAAATCSALAAPPPRPAALQALDDALPGTLINDPTKLDWPVFGGASAKAVKSPEAPGGGALQVNVLRAGANIYDVGTFAPIDAPISAGQRVTVAFYARTLKAETPDGKGVIGVRVQQNVAPFAGFADARISIGPEWKLYEATGLAERDMPAGQAVVGFQLAGAKQTVEIGQTIVVSGAESIVASARKPEMPPLLAGKGRLINTVNAPESWALYGPGLTSKPVEARGTPGLSALQVSVPGKTAQPYELGVLAPIGEAIEEGDILNVAVLARTVSTESADGLGRITLKVQKNADGYPGFGENVVTVGSTWKLIQLRTQARLDIPKGQGAVALLLGHARQVLEIENVYVLKEEPAP